MRRGATCLAIVIAATLFAVWWLDRDVDGLLPPGPGPERAVAIDAAVGGLDAAGGATPAGDIARAPGAVPQRAATAAADPFAALRTGYRGRVVSRQGQAVGGIDVRLFRGTPEAALLPGVDVFARQPAVVELEAAHDRTGADGRFRLDGVLPRGVCWLRLEWAEVERAPPLLRAGHGTLVPVQRTPAPGEVVDLGDVVLKPGATLLGRVVDVDGEPLGGAAVRCANLPPPLLLLPMERFSPASRIVVTLAGRGGVFALPGWFAKVYAMLPVTHATAAADGTFALYGVDPGTVALGVTAAGKAPLVRAGLAVAPDRTTSIGDLAVDDGEQATVLVAERDGTPVAGAEVVVAPQSATLPVHLGDLVGRSGADGTLIATGLPRGRAFAAARRSERDPWVLGEAGPTTGRLLVTLPGRCRLVLTVVDAAGQRARDVKLQLVGGQPDAGVLELAMFGAERGIDLSQRVTTLDDGRLVVDDLEQGPWRLVVTASGCGITSLHFELLGDSERTVQLRPARALPVHVVDATGAAVADAAIYVQARGGSRQERIVDVPLHAGTTDQDGRCLVRDLPTAETRVTASHPAHGQVHAIVTGSPTVLELQFLATGAIRGRLTDGGKPPAPGRWVAVLERRFDAQAARGAMPELPQLALPLLDGAFAFAALQPGNYRVTVQDSATDIGTLGGLFQYMQRRKQIFPWNKAEVVLHSGETTFVRIDAMLDSQPYDGPGAVVRGVVTIDGAPGDGALVVGTSQPGDRRVTSRVDAGTFDLGHCPAGALRVVVVPKEVAESRLLDNLFAHHFARDVTVVDGKPLQLAIDVVTGALTGTIHDRSGQPVADCRVVLFDRGGDGHSSALRVARSGGDGTFAFAQVPAGTYELTAHKDDVGRTTVRGVAIATGVAGAALAVTLDPVARVTGRIAVAGPGERRALVLEPVGGGEPLRTATEVDGRFDLRSVPFGRYRAVSPGRGDQPAMSLGELTVASERLDGVVLTPH